MDSDDTPGFPFDLEFHAETWFSEIAPRVRELAVRNLAKAGLRGEVLEEAAADVVQIVAIRALHAPVLSDVGPRAFRAATVQHTVIDWLRRNQWGQTGPLDGDPDDPPQQPRPPSAASAEEQEFSARRTLKPASGRVGFCQEVAAAAKLNTTPIHRRHRTTHTAPHRPYP